MLTTNSVKICVVRKLRILFEIGVSSKQCGCLSCVEKPVVSTETVLSGTSRSLSGEWCRDEKYIAASGKFFTVLSLLSTANTLDEEARGGGG